MNIEDRKALAEVLNKRMKFREHQHSGATELFFHAPRMTAEAFKGIAGCGGTYKAGGSYRWSLTDRKKIAWLLGQVEVFLESPEAKRRCRDVSARLDLLERRRKLLQGAPRIKRTVPKTRAPLNPAWDSSVVARVKALEANGGEV